MSPKKIGLVVATVAVLAAGAVAGASLAGAATKSSSSHAYGEGSRGFGGPGDHGGPGGGSQDTAVTGSEKTKVEAAVKAKYSSLTVQDVRKDPDGSYDVLGTKAGAPVMYDVSKDLATITERTGGPGQGHGAPPAQGRSPGATS